MTKAKKTVAKKVGSTAAAKPKGPGVIETIIATISRERGASADEVLEILKGKFPDRDPDGMRRTIGIQAPKNCTSKGTTKNAVAFSTSGVRRALS